ncbi:MAG: TlpA family protein disulfide reductase [Proteobacteria bacterium]|nr:TlpA family protein disulfide reductase [Pseudomonadota bacterium]
MLLVCLLFLFGCFLLPVRQASASSLPDLPASNTTVTIPAFELAAPPEEKTLQYLGISGKEIFKSTQIKTEVLIIEVFSMYCPHCQREAPSVNELYNEIETDSALRDKIKIIGIAAGNSSYEVDVFRKKYEIPFPLFPDKSFAVIKTLAVTETPTFVGLKVNENGDHDQFLFHVGGFEKVGKFLEKVVTSSNLKRERQ